MKIKDDVDMEKIHAFLKEIERTRDYDDNRISEYHDRIFGKEARSETNEPCPIMQTRRIKAWYQDQKKKQTSYN